MKNEKFYSYLNTEQQKIVSLNFLLSEKFISDSIISPIDIKFQESHEKSIRHKNDYFFVCCIISIFRGILKTLKHTNLKKYD